MKDGLRGSQGRAAELVHAAMQGGRKEEPRRNSTSVNGHLIHAGHGLDPRCGPLVLVGGCDSCLMAVVFAGSITMLEVLTLHTLSVHSI